MGFHSSQHPGGAPSRQLQRYLRILAVVMALTCCAGAFHTTGYQVTKTASRKSASILLAKPAGAFFNAVPPEDDNNKNKKKPEQPPPAASLSPNQATPPPPQQQDQQDDQPLDKIQESLEKLLKERNAPSLASQPSTINGIPTARAGVGFGSAAATPQKKSSPKRKTKPYIGIGEPDNDDSKPVNDVTKPEYDDQGYTLYTNEDTGEKDRVFEALVDYPCDFTMKIVGANEGTFVEELLQIVADSCETTSTGIPHKTRVNGKWISVTVEAPVQNAEMLYTLYENIDKDPRVKFKF